MLSCSQADTGMYTEEVFLHAVVYVATPGCYTVSLQWPFLTHFLFAHLYCPFIWGKCPDTLSLAKRAYGTAVITRGHWPATQ